MGGVGWGFCGIIGVAVPLCLNWDFWDWGDLWDFVVADEEGLRWVALLFVWVAPPVCPPRLPSPWPSPAERERGFRSWLIEVLVGVGVCGRSVWFGEWWFLGECVVLGSL